MKMQFDQFKGRKYLLNPYVITILLFGVVVGFVGEQSLRRSVSRAREIHKLEEQRDAYREGTREARSAIDLLRSTDSLEKYAREHYYMHAPNEDVFLIED